ncbi:response regulator receiver modulated diguanylate cyclase [Thermincola ferriacetica]|uniref:Stage 0 sporulation protein A homolog n=2 Tax=Thermincola TaxID=278993 RepID=D5XFD1_THEPJ|nr:MULTISPECIES: response regulator [Thermincola]ADG82352.1 response regulator receiver modulated diguanylate cyclase [Thermincola potens JR]KNZ70845.1 response regulator receiver modulated diguanylate cyclase [Thermincola ferriacetica]
MQETAQQRILVIDDDKFMVRIIKDCLEKVGFIVYGAEDFSSAMELIYQMTPDLILLDVVLPKMNGFEICRLLRNDTRTSHVPIIMITSKAMTEDKVAGLEAGADDYITKPFDPLELVARVKTHLRRAKQEKAFNPLTGLPGNIVIEEEIKQRVEVSNRKFAVLYLDLDNFKAYNDVYGFLKGDEVIKFVAHILDKNVKEFGNPDDFIGHIGGDDFICITTPDKVDDICTNIIEQFDSTIQLFYSSEDRRRGHIITKDRTNQDVTYPFMSISIAVVSNENRQIENHWRVAEIAAEMKKYAKSKPGSIYVKDRRSR